MGSPSTNREHRIWQNMKNRCNNPNVPAYVNYGGRGITYHPNWETFAGFWDDMQDGYQSHLTLERIDCNKGYSPDNCCWATYKEQNNNRRDNRRFEHKGLSMTLEGWAEYIGVKRSTLAQRFYVYNWGVEKMLITPVRKMRITNWQKSI